MSRLITGKRVTEGENLYRRVHHCGQVHLCERTVLFDKCVFLFVQGESGETSDYILYLSRETKRGSHLRKRLRHDLMTTKD